MYSFGSHKDAVPRNKQINNYLHKQGWPFSTNPVCINNC